MCPASVSGTIDSFSGGKLQAPSDQRHQSPLVFAGHFSDAKTFFGRFIELGVYGDSRALHPTVRFHGCRFDS